MLTQRELQDMLQDMKLETLRAFRSLIDVQILARERARFEAEVKAAGFSVKELLEGLKAPRPKFAHRFAKRKAKFVNPKNPSQTWSGRGRRPTWLRTAIRGGKPLEAFAA